MTKAEVIAEISNKSGIQKVDVSAVVEGFISIITKSVIAGEPVFIRGFGSFERKKRARKIGQNISTKQQVIIPEHNVPVFKPYPEFKEAVK